MAMVDEDGSASDMLKVQVGLISGWAAMCCSVCIQQMNQVKSCSSSEAMTLWHDTNLFYF